MIQKRRRKKGCEFPGLASCYEILKVRNQTAHFKNNNNIIYDLTLADKTKKHKVKERKKRSGNKIPFQMLA